MANIGEKAISILAGNLNSGLSYLITTVITVQFLDSALSLEIIKINLYHISQVFLFKIINNKIAG